MTDRPTNCPKCGHVTKSGAMGRCQNTDDYCCIHRQLTAAKSRIAELEAEIVELRTAGEIMLLSMMESRSVG